MQITQTILESKAMSSTMETVTQVSDALIAFSYGVIPIQIVYFFYRAKSQRDHLVVGGLFALFIWLCAMTHLLNVLHAYELNTAFKMADAVVSVATAVTLAYLLPKILAWLKTVEQHNRCEAHLVAFFTCVLLPRNGSKAQQMAIIQRCLRHIFEQEDIFVTLRSGAMCDPTTTAVLPLDWQYVALMPKEIYENNVMFFDQVTTFVRSSVMDDTADVAPASPDRHVDKDKQTLLPGKQLGSVLIDM